MTHKEITEQFTIKDGIIQDCGRFEGEYLYAPHFYDATLDGCAEELSFMEEGAGEYAALVEVTAEDRAEFPEIDADTKYVLVTQSEQGFIGVRELTDDQAELVRAEYDEMAEESE